jgi:hypothetical protein
VLQWYTWISQAFFYQVVTLEATSCIGGRIDDTQEMGVCVGKGAQILNGSTNNPFLFLCKQVRIRCVQQIRFDRESKSTCIKIQCSYRRLLTLAVEL